MEIERFPQQVIDNIFLFLDQNDKYSVVSSSRTLNAYGLKHLYKNISISSKPTIRSDKWYLDSSWTHISGARGIDATKYQNDYLIYLKLDRLMDVLSSKGELVENIKILDEVFQEDGSEQLNDLLKSLSINCPNLKSVQVFEGSELDIPASLPLDHESLTIKTDKFSDSQPTLPSDLTGIKILVLEDDQAASLRILKDIPSSPKLTLKRLVFNHTHGHHDYNTVLRPLTIDPLSCIDLSNLEELEMSIGCELNEECECLSLFLDSLSPKLHKLKKLALHELTFQRDHYITENWDVNINRFILNIPSPDLDFISIHHNTPTNGKLKNGYEGNYFRRRRLFEQVIPQLPNLKTIISPTLLQTASCYEIVVSDILWNGCECSHCAHYLPIYDKYLMDHGYYDDEDADFKDLIAPRLFGWANNELLKRQAYQYDLDTLSSAPLEVHWDFHGYDSITCFNDIKECEFDKNLFEPLVVCISHFFKDQVKYLQTKLPLLQTVVLSGVYFTIVDGEVHCVYDN